MPTSITREVAPKLLAVPQEVLFQKVKAVLLGYLSSFDTAHIYVYICIHTVHTYAHRVEVRTLSTFYIATRVNQWLWMA